MLSNKKAGAEAVYTISREVGDYKAILDRNFPSHPPHAAIAQCCACCFPVSHPSHLRSSLVRLEALRPRKRAAQIPSSHSSSSLISASPPARMAAYWSQPLSDVRDVTCSSASDRAVQHAKSSWFSLGEEWED